MCLSIRVHCLFDFSSHFTLLGRCARITALSIVLLCFRHRLAVAPPHRSPARSFNEAAGCALLKRASTPRLTDSFCFAYFSRRQIKGARRRRLSKVALLFLRLKQIKIAPKNEQITMTFSQRPLFEVYIDTVQR